MIIPVNAGGGSDADPNAADVGLLVAWDEGAAAPLDLGPDGVALTVNNSPSQFDGAYIPNLVDFNGTNQNLTWSYAAALRTDVDWTLELLLKFDALADTTRICQMFGSNGGFFSRITTGNRFWVRVSSAATADDLYSQALVTGGVYLFTITHVASTGALQMLQGGALVDTGTQISGNWQAGGSAHLGGESGFYFNGAAAVRFTGGVIRDDPFQIANDPTLFQ